MSDPPNTLFLRLEGPLQAWGDNSKFVIRRTMEAPTKSGVLGMICCAMGLSRQAARERLKELNKLAMGVRIDQPGVRWWDYHTVGARYGLLTAEGKIKRTQSTREYETLITRREYLADASFLVALQGEPSLIADLEAAIATPKWTLYLGRKCCPPSRPLLERGTGFQPVIHGQDAHATLLAALASVPWQRRLKGDAPPQTVDCLLDWEPTPEQPEAPDDALVWYDVPETFEPPAHHPRFVVRKVLRVGEDGDLQTATMPAQNYTPRPFRPRADYGNTEYRNRARQRLDSDYHVCVFCKSPLTKYNRTVQHVTYRHAGGDERLDELRSLCRLCHDAVTMIEYGLGMGLDRINPEDPRWREQIIKKRAEIIEFRSLETRRRRLSPEEV
jgi:CRISPR system Cascade subunit CasD